MAAKSSLSKITQAYCFQLHRRRLSAKPFYSSSSSSAVNTSNSAKLQQETNLETEDDAALPTSGISRPLSHILKDLNKKVPESLLRLRSEPSGFSFKYIPWFFPSLPHLLFLWLCIYLCAAMCLWQLNWFTIHSYYWR